MVSPLPGRHVAHSLPRRLWDHIFTPRPAGPSERPNLAPAVAWAYLFATASWLILMLRQLPCRWASADSNPDRFGWMCYSDLSALYLSRDQAIGGLPYATTMWEYPVLTGYFATLANGIASLFGAQLHPDISGQQMVDNMNIYLTVNAIGLFVCLLWIIHSVLRLSQGQTTLAILVAVAPAMWTNGLINWDLLAVALALAGLADWVERRHVRAGVLLGLGVAAKLFPLVIIGALFVLGLRADARGVKMQGPPRAWPSRWSALWSPESAPGRTYAEPSSAGPPGWPDPRATTSLSVKAQTGSFALTQFQAWAVTAAVAALTWILVNLPVALTQFEGWQIFYTFNSGRGADLGSWWFSLNLAGWETPNAIAWSRGCMILGYAGLAALIFFARRAPSAVQIAYLAVAIMVACNLVYSPQYVLWVLPLIVLARPVMADLAVFTVSELLYFIFIWLYLRGNDLSFGLSDAPWVYIWSIWLRLAATLFVMARVVVDVLRGRGAPEPAWLRPAATVASAVAAPAARLLTDPVALSPVDTPEAGLIRVETGHGMTEPDDSTAPSHHDDDVPATVVPAVLPVF